MAETHWHSGWLSHIKISGEIIQRQEAIKELSARPGLASGIFKPTVQEIGLKRKILKDFFIGLMTISGFFSSPFPENCNLAFSRIDNRLPFLMISGYVSISGIYCPLSDQPLACSYKTEGYKKKSMIRFLKSMSSYPHLSDCFLHLKKNLSKLPISDDLKANFSSGETVCNK